jgi:hypothetical protein
MRNLSRMRNEYWRNRDVMVGGKWETVDWVRPDGMMRLESGQVIGFEDIEVEGGR